MSLGARTAGHTEWKDAKKFGAEVYTDEHNGSTFYITELGALSAVVK
jgi:hypothetical protein